MEQFAAFFAATLTSPLAVEVTLFIGFVIILTVRRLLYESLKRRGSA